MLPVKLRMFLAGFPEGLHGKNDTWQDLLTWMNLTVLFRNENLKQMTELNKSVKQLKLYIEINNRKSTNSEVIIIDKIFFFVCVIHIKGSPI